MTRRRYCGFCGKESDEVERLIAGPCIEVCNECIDTMHQIVHESKPILPVKLKSGKSRVVIPFKRSPP